MNGAVELYKACKKHDIKPILGLEAYFVDDRTVREGKIERNHLTLLAASDEGFRNLTKLSSAGFLEGLYRGKPGVDLELPRAPRRGRHRAHRLPRLPLLAAGSSRAGSPQARAHLDDLVQVFGPEDVYFEVQRNGIAEQEQVNEAIAEVRAGDRPPARRDRRRPLPPPRGLPPPRRAAVRADEVDARRAEDDLRHQRVLFEELGGDGGVVRRHAGGARLHARDRRALRRPRSSSAAADPALRRRPTASPRRRTCARSSTRACASATATRSPPQARERADMELARHRQHGLQRLLPDRLGLRRLREGQRHRGRPGPRLGRRLDRLLLRCEITDVDPLRYDLLFERFLNAERVSMPDIDIDFSVRGRERVIRYVTEKYGADRVAQIITFGRMFPRAATRDAARVLGHDYGVGDRLAKLIPDPIRAARRASRTACSRGAELAAEVARDPIAKQIVDVAQGPRGDRPQRLDPRRRRRDRRPPADRHRPAPARRRRRGGGRREGLPHGHAVLDEADRGDRPAEDGLPRPAQPRRDRGRARHHRALDRQPDRHGDAAARRREDLRDAGPRRRGRRVPVRVRGHARGAQEGPADRVRGPRRARRALPPGRDGPDPDLRARQAQPRRRSPTSTTACARSPSRPRA